MSYTSDSQLYRSSGLAYTGSHLRLHPIAIFREISRERLERETRKMELSNSDQNGKNKGRSEARGLDELHGVLHAERVIGGDTCGEENLKKRIMEHPLYEIMLKRHLDCLKVSLGEFGEADTTEESKQTNSELNRGPASPDLDLFMETYCFTLSKLKEAMEVPMQETASFVKAMHDQLDELRDTHCC